MDEIDILLFWAGAKRSSFYHYRRFCYLKFCFEVVLRVSGECLLFIIELCKRYPNRMKYGQCCTSFLACRTCLIHSYYF